MRECDKSKNTCKQQLPIVYMSFNNVGRLITSTITTLQHFATLYHTSPNYTSLHLSTLHFLSFALHYSPVWLNPSTMLYYTVLIRRLNVIHINCSFWFYSVGSHKFTIFTSSEHKTFVHPTTKPSGHCIAEVK